MGPVHTGNEFHSHFMDSSDMFINDCCVVFAFSFFFGLVWAPLQSLVPNSFTGCPAISHGDIRTKEEVIAFLNKIDRKGFFHIFFPRTFVCLFEIMCKIHRYLVKQKNYIGRKSTSPSKLPTDSQLIYSLAFSIVMPQIRLL
jgi:hypothetical protein